MLSNVIPSFYFFPNKLCVDPKQTNKFKFKGFCIKKLFTRFEIVSEMAFFYGVACHERYMKVAPEKIDVEGEEEEELQRMNA